MDPLFVFEDIVIPDVDDILPDPNNPKEEEETGGSRGVWDSGQKENLWRSVDPKDIWTADDEPAEQGHWDMSDVENDSENLDNSPSDGTYGDII